MHARGRLDAGDGNQVFWEAAGNPHGHTALVLHGGPGSGSSPKHRQWFDPARYRVVTMDQRGSGRSLPHASMPTYDFAANTTAHLVADIERLRRHLGVERWVLVGVSWGATLALAYCRQHAARVRAVVMGAVTTTSREEVGWITGGVSAFLPAAYARFTAHVPEASADLSVLEAYRLRLGDPAPRLHQPAADAWCAWEQAVAGETAAPPGSRWTDPRFRLAFARLVTHYWGHEAWLAPGALLRAAAMLGSIPATLVHGTSDLGSPPITAWRLHQAWPNSELVLLDRAGHASSAPPMRAALVGALAHLADKLDQP